MNRIIFKIVANSLSFIGHKTGLTYNEINIISSNYVASSVWICVSLPIAIYAIFIFFIFK
jgi:hypothetical protein